MLKCVATIVVLLTLLTADAAARTGGAAAPAAGDPVPDFDRAETGGAAVGQNPNRPTVPGRRAKLLPDGRAAAPANAPRRVQQLIWHANRLIGKPYRYGGGHARVEDTGYDCSGAVSYPLVKTGVLKSPLNSGGFMRWGRRGSGRWVTVYANRSHAWMVVAGLRLDTSRAYDRRGRPGPRWRPLRPHARGFVARTSPGW